MNEKNDPGTEQPAGVGAGVGEKAKRLGADARELRGAVAEQTRSYVGRIIDFTMERPLAALGIAAGVGFVLGGGLFTRTGSRLLALGMRFGGIALARNLFGEMAEQARAS